VIKLVEVSGVSSNEKIILPAGRRILIAAGDFKFMLELFVILFFVAYSPYPFLASVSAALTLPIYLYIMPLVSKKINGFKSPLNRILLPFAFVSITVCPIFVQMFRLNVWIKPMRIIFTIFFLPLFSTLMSVTGIVSNGISRELGDDKLYNFSKIIVRVISIALLFVLSVFFKQKAEAFASIIAIIVIFGFLIQYMAIFDFSSRFKPKEDVKIYDLLEVVWIIALMAMGVFVSNSVIYCLADKGAIVFGIIVSGFALMESGAIYILKTLPKYSFILDKITRISLLTGLVISGLIIALKTKLAVIIATASVSLLMIIGIIIVIVYLKKENKISKQ